MNPFKEQSKPVENYIESLKDVYPRHYDKSTTDPYTKCRIILACGAEYEANWCSHQSLRKIQNNDLRRELSLSRYVEKQQQQKLAQLKPLDESTLETTISYEQLAVDLTAEMAQKEKNANVKKALDFALLEDFDHLYRYSDLLDMDDGVHAEKLVGGYTEITPARPTVAHHRHPYDNVKKSIDGKNNSTLTNLHTMIITAAEQQTMNFYMNQASCYANDLGRRLYEEICLVEEEHVTQYGSLIDVSPDLLESHLWHEYTECYIYWSNMLTETDKNIKKLWEYYYELELSHLHSARALLKKYAKKDYDEVISDAEFPSVLSLHSNVDYVRNVMVNSVQKTGNKEDYVDITELPEDGRFFEYNKAMTSPRNDEAGHKVIEEYISKYKTDYRFEVKENPLSTLRRRNKDNNELGIKPTEIKASAE